MTNKLASETSPYLLQHKDNPVDWYPWGEEALARARGEDRPILLSVGYSACHWCHVMAHESFEDADTAAVMNELFVNIKVDREERPDIDAIYMQAVQSMTGRGGWPMTVFLTPDGWPFYGGTYYPPEDRHGMPAFRRVLQAVSIAYRDRRDDIGRAAEQLRAHLDVGASFRPGATDPGEDILAEAVEGTAAEHDARSGGFGQAPKFPQPMLLDFLLRYHKSSGDARALEMAETTLQKMASGGMYDQVGGGFHRYSTDAMWLVPHFEKMLYDNAQLARVYLDAYKLTGKQRYREVCKETLDYVLREMTDASGGFYSTQDADSEGVEGKFFLWTPAELKEVLGDDAALIGDFFGVSADGNFEGKNILNLEMEASEFAEARGVSGEEFAAKLASAKGHLYAAREQRVHPGRDEKVLSGWNGMMLRAFAEAAAALDSEPYREAARRNADFLLGEMRRDGRLLRTWKDGEAKLKGYLEDYANLIDGLLATHAATFELGYLRAAIEVADEMVRLFWDSDTEGFFDTGSDHEELIARPRNMFDNATPSGSSVAGDVLLRLARITGREDFQNYALATLRTFAPVVPRAPTSFGRLLAALHFHLSPDQELAVVLPAGGGAAARTLAAPAFEGYRPSLVVVGGPEGEGSDITPLMEERATIDGRPAAYLCERFVCQMPTTEPSVLAGMLANS